jgi:PAS domain S-box-containing protein
MIVVNCILTHRVTIMTTLPLQPSHHYGFFTRIILPTLLTICLFVLTLFFILIPAFEHTILERKREMIRELTQSAWSVMAELEAEEQEGKLTRIEAQQRAIDRIQFLRYGDERKDYFWITDMEPRMVMHPYRPELNRTQVADYEDPTGKHLFSEFVTIVRQSGEGYVDYMWQWKDDENRIVPKLSYVKGFQPWGWIIGTGIYIEDVKEEIAAITRRLLSLSIGITAAITFLLLFVTWQSLTIEKRRRTAESDLRLSREKYKTLVDAATEGFFMIIAGKVFYANQTALEMLGYPSDSLINTSMNTLLADPAANPYWNDFLADKPVPSQYPAQLRKQDDTIIPVLLSTSKMSFEGKDAIVMIAKDIAFHQQLENKLGESKEKYETLTNNISVGVIRSALGSKGQVLEANPAAVAIFGCEDKQEILSMPLQTFIHEEDEYQQFLQDLNHHNSVKNRIMRLRKKNGHVSIVAVSAVLIKDENQYPQFFDAIIEDITAQKKSEEEREDLIVELQTTLLYLNQPIRHSLRTSTECEMNQSIKRAAEIMSKQHNTAILIKSDSGEYLGIITDRDIRKRVVAENLDNSRPAFEIMSAPLITISDHALIFEAALLMQEKNIRHLAVKDNTGAIIGMITGKELLQVHRYSSAILLQQIQSALTLDEMIEAHDRVPRLVKGLIDSGANAKNITRIITTVSDTITTNLVQLCMEELGPPPAAFAFVALGSEGREEQTLITDQDNAILYEDVPPDKHETVQQYFLALAQKVCKSLDQAGYTLCKGNIMAMNPDWCQPISQWKSYFSQWITDADPQALLDVKIFFDYRFLFGEEHLVEELTTHIHKNSTGKAAFFQHLAANILHFKPPLGFFGNIVLKTKEGHHETFDIKEAMLPIVDFARIYAIKHHITETNTLTRLQRLYENDVISKSSYENALQAYHIMMQIRFKHQATAMNNNLPPDNFINPKTLSNLEQIMLKKTFSQLGDFQSKLSFDFTGSV